MCSLPLLTVVSLLCVVRPCEMTTGLAGLDDPAPHLLSLRRAARQVAPAYHLRYNRRARRVLVAPRVHGLGRLHPAEATFYPDYTQKPARPPAGFTIGFPRLGLLRCRPHSVAAARTLKGAKQKA
jgi:hypothetical protein